MEELLENIASQLVILNDQIETLNKLKAFELVHESMDSEKVDRITEHLESMLEVG